MDLLTHLTLVCSRAHSPQDFGSLLRQLGSSYLVGMRFLRLQRLECGQKGFQLLRYVFGAGVGLGGQLFNGRSAPQEWSHVLSNLSIRA